MQLTDALIQSNLQCTQGTHKKEQMRSLNTLLFTKESYISLNSYSFVIDRHDNRVDSVEKNMPAGYGK